MNKTGERIATWPLVETSWLAEHLGSSDLRIIDCSIKHQDHDSVRKYFSGKVEWEKAHIPGSVYINSLTEIYGHDATRPYAMPTPEQFAATMESIGIDDDTQVVLYDNSDHAWAAFVWWMLRVIGIDNAVVFNGGWQKWAKGTTASFHRGKNIPCRKHYGQVPSGANGNPATRFVRVA